MKATILATLVLGSTILPVAANATQVRHRHAKAAAAGLAAYEAAKHTGKTGHKNFIQRHPKLAGVATAIAVSHHLKKKPNH